MQGRGNMRDLTSNEMRLACGGTVAEFNQCMADNWWDNTISAGVGGAIAGAFFGPGAVVGGLGGIRGGSTGTAVSCGFDAIF